MKNPGMVLCPLEDQRNLSSLLPNGVETPRIGMFSNNIHSFVLQACKTTIKFNSFLPESFLGDQGRDIFISGATLGLEITDA